VDSRAAVRTTRLMNQISSLIAHRGGNHETVAAINGELNQIDAATNNIRKIMLDRETAKQQERQERVSVEHHEPEHKPLIQPIIHPETTDAQNSQVAHDPVYDAVPEQRDNLVHEQPANPMDIAMSGGARKRSASKSKKGSKEAKKASAPKKASRTKKGSRTMDGGKANPYIDNLNTLATTIRGEYPDLEYGFGLPHRSVLGKVLKEFDLDPKKSAEKVRELIKSKKYFKMVEETKAAQAIKSAETRDKKKASKEAKK